MGVILGPMAEGYFLTSMVSTGSDLSVFVTRPVSAALLALSGSSCGRCCARCASAACRRAPEGLRARLDVTGRGGL
jgi:TctA family transporter